MTYISLKPTSIDLAYWGWCVAYKTNEGPIRVFRCEQSPVIGAIQREIRSLKAADSRK